MSIPLKINSLEVYIAKTNHNKNISNTSHIYRGVEFMLSQE